MINTTTSNNVNVVEICVVIPVKDEAKNIEELVQRLFNTFNNLKISFEVIFVTDINTDNTFEILVKLSKQYQNIKIIKLSNRFGHHVSVIAGLDHCHAKLTLMMDGDLQDHPEDIPLLYNKIKEGFDVVYAVKKDKNNNFFRNISSNIFNYLISLMTDIKTVGNSSMFRIISEKALKEILKYREFEPSLTYIFNLINLPTASVTVTSGFRKYGKSKYNFFDLVGFAVSSLLSFSRKPLRMISGIGLFMSAGSLLYLIIVIFQFLLLKIELVGWTTIVVLITLVSGIQLFSLGLIGEYIGRIFMQTKNRPLYIIEEKIGKFD